MKVILNLFLLTFVALFFGMYLPELAAGSGPVNVMLIILIAVVASGLTSLAFSFALLVDFFKRKHWNIKL